jgi:hypothetical protein
MRALGVLLEFQLQFRKIDSPSVPLDDILNFLGLELQCDDISLGLVRIVLVDALGLVQKEWKPESARGRVDRYTGGRGNRDWNLGSRASPPHGACEPSRERIGDVI